MRKTGKQPSQNISLGNNRIAEWPQDWPRRVPATGAELLLQEQDPASSNALDPRLVLMITRVTSITLRLLPFLRPGVIKRRGS